MVGDLWRRRKGHSSTLTPTRHAGMKTTTLLLVGASSSVAFTAPSTPLYRKQTHRTARYSSSTRTLVDIRESASRDVNTMDEWATACGVQRSDGFSLTTGEDGYDVSVVTQTDLPAGSPVLFVPNEMILSSNQVVQELGRLEEAETSLRGLGVADQMRQFYLMVKILMEYEKGEESPWFPWLNALPRFFTNGASMTTFCFECLPPLAASLAMRERTNLISMDVNKVPYLSDETKNNGELVRWAFQIACTRGLEANDGSVDLLETSENASDLRIAPMADMFNHGTYPELEIGYDEYGNLHAQTNQDVPAGSPLRISYGDPTNPSYLFARYGFVDDSSPATFCKIMIPHVNDQLRDIGYAHNRMLFFKDTGEASEEVFDVLLYQILSSTNAAKKKEFYDAHMHGDYETKQRLHEQYWPETSAKLQRHIDSLLSQVEDISTKAHEQDINLHPRLPLIMRHNEFVRDTFRKVRAHYFG